jgi:LPXTG-site transpeptidase (sortase) family protein
MFKSRSVNLMIILALLALVVTGLPGIARAADPAGITPTPTNTVPPPTDTPTDTPPGPTATPALPLPTDTPTLPPTEGPTPTDGTVVPPPPSATPTVPTTEEPTEPPPKAPRNTNTPEPPLLPETGQLPPDGGNDGPGGPRQLGLLLLAFLGALVIGFTGGKRLRDWLASRGILGTILILLLLSAGLALWSNGVPTAAAGNPGGTYSEAPLQAEEQAFSLAKGAASISGFVDRAEKSTAGQPAGAQASSSAVLAAPLAAAAALRTERDDSAAQRLRIPYLKVDAQVVPVPFDGRTWDVNEIAAEVAWLGGTSQPGLGGNTVLAGHITAREIGNGPFRYLNRLSPGEEIFVYTDQKIYLYRVREFRIVEARDGAVTAATDNPQLTLVTCSTWDEQVESYVKRRVVYADLARVIPINVSRTVFQAQ